MENELIKIDDAQIKKYQGFLETLQNDHRIAVKDLDAIK